MKNRELLSKGNPFKAVIVFAIPSIISMTINAFYNVVDKIFIGKYTSPEALEGLQVVSPLMNIAFAFVVMFGLGSSSYSGNKLGEKKDKEANIIFNNSFLFAILVPFVLSIIFFILSNPILKLAGALETNIAYARDYYQIILLGFIFQSGAYFFLMNIRTEGRPNFAILTQVTGCIVNVVFDYIFIVVLNMGVKGAALATVIGHLSNFLIGIIFYTITKMHFFCFNLKEMFHINWHYIYQVMTIGISSTILNFCTGFAVIIFNRVLGKYPNGLSIMAILTSLDTFIVMPCVGLRQGLLPLFSYNYGEKNYQRMFKLYGVGAIYGVSFGIVISLLLAIFPTFFVSLFVNVSEVRIIEEASRICRFYYIGVTLISFNMNTSAFYQSSRQKLKASILSAMRQCIFLIPLIFIFDKTSGFKGIWWSTPISDILSALSSFIFFFLTYLYSRKTGYLCHKDLRLKEKNE